MSVLDGWASWLRRFSINVLRSPLYFSLVSLASRPVRSIQLLWREYFYVAVLSNGLLGSGQQVRTRLDFFWPSVSRFDAKAFVHDHFYLCHRG